MSDEGNVLDVKHSACKRYMAIQRSDTEVEVVDTEKLTSLKLGCRQKKGNCVLRGGVLWLRTNSPFSASTVRNRAPDPSLLASAGFDKDKSKAKDKDKDKDKDRTVPLQAESSNTARTLAIVTRFGIEIHRLPNRNSMRGEGVCKLLSTVKHAVQCFWHLPQHHVLVLATENGKELRPFQFQNGHHPTKLAKFTLESVPAQRDIVLAKLYDSIYCVHIESKAMQLRLYQIGREESQLTHVFRLSHKGSVGVSVLDNLLCVHHMDAKVSSLYDIHAQGK